MGVAINPEKISITELEERLRHMPVPLIPRTANDTDAAGRENDG